MFSLPLSKSFVFFFSAILCITLRHSSRLHGLSASIGRFLSLNLFLVPSSSCPGRPPDCFFLVCSLSLLLVRLSCLVIQLCLTAHVGFYALGYELYHHEYDKSPVETLLVFLKIIVELSNVIILSVGRVILI